MTKYWLVTYAEKWGDGLAWHSTRVYKQANGDHGPAGAVLQHNEFISQKGQAFPLILLFAMEITEAEFKISKSHL